MHCWHWSALMQNEKNIIYILMHFDVFRAARCDNATSEPAALTFCCCFFFLQREISAVSRPIAAKLCHMIGNRCNFKN